VSELVRPLAELREEEEGDEPDAAGNKEDIIETKEPGNVRGCGGSCGQKRYRMTIPFRCNAAT
jgi:hypothetical protein